MARAQQPIRVGWEDQIVSVLLGARGPLWTREVGEKARVIPTGPFVSEDIAQRAAGDPGQQCYRMLAKLEREGLVWKTYRDGDFRAWWEATPLLRARRAEVDQEFERLVDGMAKDAG
jgi:hypothetical protein